jgi:hypothetical protein
LTEIGATLAIEPAGDTTIGVEAVTEELATDVATTVASDVPATVAGTVYVTEVELWPLKVPGPLSDQFTPALVVSLTTVATMFTVWPALSESLVGESEIVTARPDGVPLLPHPTRIPRVPTKTKTKKLRTLSSLL